MGRKSVGFDLAAAPGSTRSRRSLSGAKSPAVRQQPERSALKRSNTPGGCEVDGGFKFKRRKNPKRAVAAAPVPDPPEKEHAPAPITTLAAVPQPPADATSSPAPPAALAARPTLCGAPPELLFALYEVCSAPGSLPAETAPLLDACMDELARAGVHSAPAADSNEALQHREAVLRARVSELEACAAEWDAAADAGLPSRAVIQAESLGGGGGAVVEMPELPELLSELQTHAALCADQVDHPSTRKTHPCLPTSPRDETYPSAFERAAAVLAACIAFVLTRPLHETEIPTPTCVCSSSGRPRAHGGGAPRRRGTPGARSRPSPASGRTARQPTPHANRTAAHRDGAAAIPAAPTAVGPIVRPSRRMCR